MPLQPQTKKQTWSTLAKNNVEVALGEVTAYRTSIGTCTACLLQSHIIPHRTLHRHEDCEVLVSRITGLIIAAVGEKVDLIAHRTANSLSRIKGKTRF